MRIFAHSFKQKDILQLQQGEPFAVGIQVLAQFPLKELRKLENFTILFVNRGTARIEIDFCTYDIKANCHIGLAADLFLQFLEISPDFTVSYLTFTRDIQFEIDTPFPPPFFAFLKQYPVSPTLPTKEMEKNNPHGLGDYPRRMIVVDNQETKNSMENENERRKERADSEDS